MSEDVKINFVQSISEGLMTKEERDELEERFQAAHKKVKTLQADRDWTELAQEIHVINEEKGFWKEPEMMDKYVAKIALIHSELTEVMEALRKSQGTDKVTEEFADVLIRTFDLYDVLVAAGEADAGLYRVMIDKIETNKNRAPKHGNRWG